MASLRASIPLFLALYWQAAHFVFLFSRFNSLEDANPSGPLAPLHGMMSFKMTSPCSVCVFVLCVWARVTLHTLPPPLRPTALILPSKRRCCSTHTSATVSQTAVLAQVLTKSRVKERERDRCALPGRQNTHTHAHTVTHTHSHTQKKEARWCLEWWCDVRQRKKCGGVMSAQGGDGLWGASRFNYTTLLLL